MPAESLPPLHLRCSLHQSRKYDRVNLSSAAVRKRADLLKRRCRVNRFYRHRRESSLRRKREHVQRAGAETSHPGGKIPEKSQRLLQEMKSKIQQCSKVVLKEQKGRLITRCDYISQGSTDKKSLGCFSGLISARQPATQKCDKCELQTFSGNERSLRET